MYHPVATIQRPYQPHIPSDGARLKYTQILSADTATSGTTPDGSSTSSSNTNNHHYYNTNNTNNVPNNDVEIHTPTIHRAATANEIVNMALLVQPSSSSSSSSSSQSHDRGSSNYNSALNQNISRIFLVRQEGAQQAYALTHAAEQAIDLRKPGRPSNWGSLFCAKIYPTAAPTASDNNDQHHHHHHQYPNNIFQVPTQSREVIIKRLNKKAINSYLRSNPCGENPYKELARMEEIGDNIHVLRHEEALEDDIYLYIVLPKGLMTLKDAIHWHERYTSENEVNELMEPERCHEIFCKIIQILAYLEYHKINHHDLSPDNLLFLSEHNLVLFDFALSNRIPVNPYTGQRTLIAPPRGPVYGKLPWMDCIVYRGTEKYDGVGMDLYAAGLVLYSMSTNEVMYTRPDANMDLDYRHFIHFQGLWSSGGNERIHDQLHIYGRQMQNHPQSRSYLQRLLKLSILHFNINDQIIDLLEHMLHEDPTQRYTLAEVMESDYVVNDSDIVFE